MMGSTRGARPRSHSERHFPLFIPTGGTGPATRIPAGPGDHGLAAWGCFVCGLTAKFAKPHVLGSARQCVVFEHPRHVQILGADDVEAFYEHRSQWVQGIRPNIGNAGMPPGDPSRGFDHISVTAAYAFLSGWAGRAEARHGLSLHPSGD